MTYTVTLELPDSLDFTIGGKEVVLRTADIASESYMAMFLTGRRKANDLFNSQRNSYKNANPGKDWSEADCDKARDAIVTKIKAGDWGRDSTPSDPVGALAERLAQDMLLTKAREAAVALGMDATKAHTARAATLRDHHKKLAAFLAGFGDWSGKNGNTLTWDSTKIADVVARHDLRKEAEAQISTTATLADDVDVDDLLTI